MDLFFKGRSETTLVTLLNSIYNSGGIKQLAIKKIGVYFGKQLR
jgi:hypothetical protein